MYRGYEITNIPSGMTAQFGDQRRLRQLWEVAAGASMPIIVAFW